MCTKVRAVFFFCRKTSASSGSAAAGPGRDRASFHTACGPRRVSGGARNSSSSVR
jgi:hypothetical protein